MGLMDRVKAFFDKEPKNRQLSSSVVTHDRLDDGYLEDFRGRSTTFERVFENAPEVPIGAPPKQCPHCGHDDDSGVWWDQQGDQIACASCGGHIAMPEGTYTLWSDLVSDVWRAHFTQDEPRVKAQGEIKPSHELHRRIMSTVTANEEFLNTRPMTRMSDIESGIAAMGASTKLKDSIREGALSEHARRAEQMTQHEQDIEETERKLEDFREAWENNTLTDEQKQTLRELAAAHDAASRDLANVQAEAQANPISHDVIEEIAEAVATGAGQAEAMNGLVQMAGPGVSGSSHGYADPDKMFALAERWHNSDILQKVSELMGRLEREMRYRRANRVVGGFEEIVDIELGDDIAHLMPMEYAKLRGSKGVRKQFHRQFVEKSLQQFEIRGNEPEGKGPVVLLVDGSYSMNGDRNVWARAVTLAIVNIAHKERRDAAVIEFADADSQKLWFFPGRGELDPEEIIDCASHFFGGGTDIGPAVREGRKVMEGVPDFRKADLCIITDGEDFYGDDDEEEKGKLLSRGVRIHGVGIAVGLGYLKQMCDHVTLVSDVAMGGENEATTALAESIT